MAFAATVEWDVQTGGSDANGGGFDAVSGTPGTDYSQQTSPQVTYTDLVIDGATNTDCTSAGNPFTAAHVGNIVNVTSGSGFTVQRVQVMSVTAGVARMDKSLGTLGSTGGNGKLGGCLLTHGIAGSLAIVGNVVHVKAGTYSITSTSSNVANGRMTLTAGAHVLGYSTTHGDNPTGSSRPIMRWGVNAASNFLITNASNSVIAHHILDCNRANYTNVAGVYISSASSIVYNCKIMGGSVYTGFAIQAAAVIDSCEITDCTGSAYSIGAPGATFINCYIHDNTVTTNQFTCSNASNHAFINCIFDTGTPIAAFSSTTVGASFVNCVFYGMTGGGFTVTASVRNVEMVNCVFMGSSTYGFETSAAYTQISMVGCAFYNNTSGKYNTANIRSFQAKGEITLTADPFVDAANGDFRLNMKAGGGALLRGAGYPQTFPGLTWAHRRDIGAHQHSGSSRGING